MMYIDGLFIMADATAGLFRSRSLSIGGSCKRRPGIVGGRCPESFGLPPSS